MRLLYLICLLYLPTIYKKENKKIKIQNMKRTNRRLSVETKQKISQALQNRPKSIRHRQALSIALKKYWQTIPYEESVMES